MLDAELAIGVQLVLSGSRTLGNLREGFALNLEDVTSVLDFGLLITLAFFGRSDWSLATESSPEFWGCLATLKPGKLSLGVLSLENVHELSTLHLLGQVSVGADPKEEVLSGDDEEDIALVQALANWFPLDEDRTTTALDLEQLGTGLGVDWTEATWSAAVHVTDTTVLVEEFDERLGLVVLGFTVLGWLTIEPVIKFDSLDGSSAVLVLGGLSADPVEDVTLNTLAGADELGVEDDVGVARVESAEVGPWDDLELLDPPDIEGRGLWKVEESLVNAAVSGHREK